MDFTSFSNDDFAVFSIDGLDPRMEALKKKIRPKLESLGEVFTQSLTVLTCDEIFPHVAKHARRTKNPPINTWVAFAANRRGYKMLPHFEIGICHTHLFIWFAVIAESPNRQEIGQRLLSQIDQIYSEVPDDFVWSVDHTKPSVIPHDQLSKEELRSLFENLKTVKKAEILCGYCISKDIAVEMDSSSLLKQINDVLVKLMPLYKHTNF